MASTLDNYLGVKKEVEQPVKINSMIRIAVIEESFNALCIKKDYLGKTYNRSLDDKLIVPEGVYIDSDNKFLFFIYKDKVTELAIKDNIRKIIKEEFSSAKGDKDKIFALYGGLIKSLYAFDENDLDINDLNLKIKKIKKGTDNKFINPAVIEIPIPPKISSYEPYIDEVLANPDPEDF
ncbi:Uncharacterised protein [Candidatus Tiddalikarchaeum anstoanum]|nr:Uncharacterised protein [Candidatus Tiddalikarchaeum anstoanum]